MPNLTQRIIDTTKHPEQGQVIYRDSELTGFAMRVTPGAKSYIVESRVNGVKRRFTIGRCDLMSLEDARKRARELLAGMTAGADPTAAKRIAQTASVTLAEVLDVYLATKELRPGTIQVYRRMCNNAFKAWLHMPIVQITKDMCVLRIKSNNDSGGNRIRIPVQIE
jgi:hypothetical protein